MALGRYHHNLVVLADGKVLAVGGASSISADTTAGAVAAELWDPATETWTTLASQQFPRMYHSTALLLPDGRVMSAGGGRWSLGIDYPNAEYFSPPYLFQGPRPVIDTAPAYVDYGAGFDIGTADASSITDVALVSLGQNTHSLNMQQHYVPLSFAPGASQLAATAPANPNDAPPGYYMLFILRDGVPSVAKIVKLGGTPPPPTPTPTATSAGTSTPTATATATWTPSSTPTPTPTPSASGTASPTSTPNANSATATLTPTASPPATSTATPTASPTATSTATVTATPLATPVLVTFGRTSTSGVNDTINYGWLTGYRATLGQAGKLKSLSVYVGATSPGAHLRVALYTNGGNGRPGTLIAQTAEANASLGWNTLPVPGDLPLAAAQYWIIVQTDDPQTLLRYAYTSGSGEQAGWTNGAYGAFAQTIPSWELSPGTAYSMYGSIEVSP
jgi:hypothetical protein